MKTFIAIAGLFSLLAVHSAYGADNGTLVVLNKSDHTVSLIDLATKSSRATIPTGKHPHEVAMSPDGKTAVIANYGNAQEPGSSLTVIDVPARKAVKTIDLGEYRRPHGVVWMTGDRVAVTVEGSRAWLIVNVSAGSIETAFETAQDGSHMVAVAPKAQRAFVTNIGSGSLSAFDLTTGKKLADIPTGAGAEGIDVSRDEREVWVTNGRADTVSIVDVASLQVRSTLASKSRPIRAKFTADGKYVLVSNATSGDVAVFDATAKKEIKRISMRLDSGAQSRGPVPVGVLVSPSLSRAYVANTNADIVTVIDLATWTVVERLTAGKEPDGLGYSPLVLQ
jgi:YVTN family beta-propeller protein